MDRLQNDLQQFICLLLKNTIFDHRKNPYEGVGSLKLFGTKKYIEYGIGKEEKKLCSHFENTPGKALIIGCSAGRESLYLARKGWKVTGIDYIKYLISIAKIFTQKMGFDIDYRVLDIKKIDSNSFPQFLI